MSIKWQSNALYFANSSGSLGRYDLETMCVDTVANGLLIGINKVFISGKQPIIFIQKENNEINCIDLSESGSILGSVGRYLASSQI